MKKQLSIFLAGVLLVVPLAVTAYLIYWAGSSLDTIGRSILSEKLPPGVGAISLLVSIYLVGLLGRFWMFQGLMNFVERVVSSVPGIKTLYESVRDLLKLFGGDAQKMGKVVQYTLPQSNVTVLGILTNSNPPKGQINGDKTVAVYLPFSYMFGGITVYCRPDEIRQVDMPVEEALKLCATAFVGPEEPSSAASVSDQPAPSES